ncbi:putative Integral membrane protein [Monocercomonoides exilis]|uniref:putative Integral membrane protein n=1 Tax=Monocercomonoides exilis TaxID=2049356 RepID=UPI00355940E3|nr:putative Integral membrane protein [Monocercomonoides exilis]|eukprot:MONOS_4438.1-p1 / transcript=MONOS_4438.1 / gene=MONOS_4438 / organism=Monocercomonoides_exilis_PA203 / gene_product=Transmembrane domain-containing protein / transcript_product=Transmembrane domain-containing protein / location=Mono_scaffold00118:23016-27252(-) / protein_length=920 / sequence_SO=supercontig / SO=protein_coding / is_pseudo=false
MGSMSNQIPSGSKRSVGGFAPYRNPDEKPKNMMSDPRIYRGNTYSRPVELHEKSFVHQAPERKQQPSFLATRSSKVASTTKPKSNLNVRSRGSPSTTGKSSLTQKVEQNGVRQSVSSSLSSSREMETNNNELEDDVYEIIPGDELTPTPIERPPTPEYIPPPYGQDESTQTDDKELFDFDYEVVPFIEILVGRALQQADLELEEDIQLARLRERRDNYEHLRNAELVENQRWEDSAQRREQEFERRERQREAEMLHSAVLQKRIQSQHKARISMLSLRIAAQKKFHQHATQIASSSSSSSSSSASSSSSFSSSSSTSTIPFTTVTKHQIESTFLPWLQNSVTEKIEKKKTARSLAADLMRQAQQKAQERLEARKAADAQRAHEQLSRSELQREDIRAKKERGRWLPAVLQLMADQQAMAEEDLFSNAFSIELRAARGISDVDPLDAVADAEELEQTAGEGEGEGGEGEEEGTLEQDALRTSVSSMKEHIEKEKEEKHSKLKEKKGKFMMGVDQLKMVQKKFTAKAIVGVALMMIFGTGTMVAAKLLLNTKTPGMDGQVKKFSKAIYQSILMFFAMSMCYPWYQISELLMPTKREKQPGDYSVNSQNDLQHPSSSSKGKSNITGLIMIALPALCDLLATTLMTTGLIFIKVSVMQMLRGSMVIFSAILTVFFRHRKLRPFEWIGVALCCTALVLVGIASIIGGEDDEDSEYKGWGYQFMGCMFVIGSQVIQAIQIVVEELLLSDLSQPPLVVVGMEGFWGMLLSIFCFIPIFHFIPGKDNGRYENTHDTFYRVCTSGKLLAFSGMYWISILLLNYGGMIVTSELTAVHRTIFEALRTLFIWITQLIIYYSGNPEYGEKWTNWSYMQAGGFAVLVLSMLVYNSVIKMKCWFDYSEPTETDERSDTSMEPENIERLPLLGKDQ